MAAIAELVLAVWRPEVDGRGLHVKTALAPALVSGDPIQVERLVGNLVDNAARHNLDHGRFNVTTVTREEHAVLSVANTGPVVRPLPPTTIRLRLRVTTGAQAGDPNHSRITLRR